MWLKQPAHQNATSLEFQQQIQTILQTQLGPAAGGYSAVAFGGCDNIIVSNAQYCQ